MTTQLALEVTPKAPIRCIPQQAITRCPVRDRCLLVILGENTAYRCGFEQAGTVPACPKRQRLEGER